MRIQMNAHNIYKMNEFNDTNAKWSFLLYLFNIFNNVLRTSSHILQFWLSIQLLQ